MVSARPAQLTADVARARLIQHTTHVFPTETIHRERQSANIHQATSHFKNREATMRCVLQLLWCYCVLCAVCCVLLCWLLCGCCASTAVSSKRALRIRKASTTPMPCPSHRPSSNLRGSHHGTENNTELRNDVVPHNSPRHIVKCVALYEPHIEHLKNRGRTQVCHETQNGTTHHEASVCCGHAPCSINCCVMKFLSL